MERMNPKNPMGEDNAMAEKDNGKYSQLSFNVGFPLTLIRK